MTTSLPDNNAGTNQTQNNKNLAERDIPAVESSTSDSNGNSSSGDGGRGQNETIGDIEMGTTTTKSTSKNDMPFYDAMEEDVTSAVDSDVEHVQDNAEVEEFTHILVPHPSYDYVHVKESEGDCNDKSKKNSCDTIAQDRFFGKSKEKEETITINTINTTTTNEGSNNTTEAVGTIDDESFDDSKETTNQDEDDTMTPTNTNRSAPIFCAICLVEYTLSERVCWSSNPNCTHVFHEDCILQWLIMLGRKRSRRQSFSRNPSVKKLLNYELCCPCCRRDFVSKNF